MTCIVGIAQNGKVYMGADSCGSDSSYWLEVSNHKVFTVGPFIIGCCGSFRMIDLLTYSLTGVIQRPEDSDDKFIRTVFVNEIKKCLKEADALRDNHLDGEFLVGYKGKLYVFQSDFSILNCDQWGHATGSGIWAAKGSLWTTQSEIKNEDGTTTTNHFAVKERLILALRAAEACVPSVRGPFVIKEVQ